MMPWARLMTRPMLTSEPPHSRSAARSRSVRRARMVTTRRTAPITSAPGSSHDIMLPNSALKSRVTPVGPHMLPATRPPPTLPDSFPSSRPKPL